MVAVVGLLMVTAGLDVVMTVVAVTLAVHLDWSTAVTFKVNGVAGQSLVGLLQVTVTGVPLVTAIRQKAGRGRHT